MIGTPEAAPEPVRQRRVRSEKGPSRHFRADIQALRAIAVLLVVVYHLRPNRMPGGYIGVDVFFVISGFLITSHLIREASRTGRVRLGAFWAARARRILPASLVAIAATILLTAWLAPVTLFDDLRKQALASIFYVENWVLAADAVDYLAAENEPTAFQHFWSLSVEEQFYLFWPLLVFLAVWILSRRAGERGLEGRERRFRRLLMLLFGTVVVLSLIVSIVAVTGGQPDAYFVTTTRIWELGAGGLLAVVSVRRLSRAARYVLAYAGLAAIFGSAFLLTSETPFPGPAALPVILGTMAVILAGTPGEDEGPVSSAKHDPWTFVSRLSVSQWIGDRSYSLYLWHFPVIVLWTMVADRKVDYLDLIAMSVVSVVLAHFSYRFIEQPVRKAPYFSSSTRRSLVVGGTAMVAVAALTFAYPAMMARAGDSARWNELAAQAAALPSNGAAAVSDGEIPTFLTADPVMTPSPLLAEDDRNEAFSADECVARISDPVTPTCTVGDPGADVSVVLVGDSHARMYSTAFADMAEQDGWHLRTYLHNRCPFNPVPRTNEVEGETVCTAPNAVVLDEILEQKPDLVITTWSEFGVFVDPDATGTPGAEGFAEYWNTLEDAGIQVLVLEDVPRMGTNIPDCLAKGDNYDDPDECGRSPEKASANEAVLTEAAGLAPRVDVADFSDVFCTDDLCKPVIGNVVVYSDTHHLTDTFARTMIPRLRAAVDDALATR